MGKLNISAFRRLGFLGGKTAFIIAVLILGIAASDKSKIAWDYSLAGNFTIHPELIRIIKEKDNPVSMLSVWPDTMASVISEQLQQVSEIDERIQYTHIDPELDRAVLERYEKQHGELDSYAIHLFTGERHFRIPLNRRLIYTLQQDLGGALVNLNTDSRVPVYFVHGHGELSATEAGANSAAEWQRLLQLHGYEVKNVDAHAIRNAGHLPDDGVVVFAGTRSPVGESIIRSFHTLLRDGGSICVLGNHSLPDDLGYALRLRGIAHGISITRTPQQLETWFDHESPCLPPLVIRSIEQADRGGTQRFDRIVLPKENFLNTTILANAADSGQVIMSPMSTHLIPYTAPDTQDASSATAKQFAKLGTPPFVMYPLLAIPGSLAWLSPPNDESTIGNYHKESRFAIAAAAEYAPHPQSVNPEKKARLLVWGSREIASDPQVAQQGLANANALLESIDWLAHQDTTTVIPEANRDLVQVRTTDDDMSLLLILLLIVMPCLFIGGAMLTWWDRR